MPQFPVRDSGLHCPFGDARGGSRKKNFGGVIEGSARFFVIRRIDDVLEAEIIYQGEKLPGVEVHGVSLINKELSAEFLASEPLNWFAGARVH